MTPTISGLRSSEGGRNGRLGATLLMDPTDENVFEPRFAALETARAWSPRVLSRLESAIRRGSDRSLFRINPLAFGFNFGIAEPEAIDLFIHASAAGLFEMDWLLLCPMCACASSRPTARRGCWSSRAPCPAPCSELFGPRRSTVRRRLTNLGSPSRCGGLDPYRSGHPANRAARQATGRPTRNWL
jgi:hypothetical protein